MMSTSWSTVWMLSKESWMRWVISKWKCLRWRKGRRARGWMCCGAMRRSKASSADLTWSDDWSPLSNNSEWRSIICCCSCTLDNLNIEVFLNIRWKVKANLVWGKKKSQSEFNHDFYLGSRLCVFLAIFNQDGLILFILRPSRDKRHWDSMLERGKKS